MDKTELITDRCSRRDEEEGEEEEALLVVHVETAAEAAAICATRTSVALLVVDTNSPDGLSAAR